MASRPLRTFAALVMLALAGCDDGGPPLPPRPVIAVTVVPLTSRVFGPFAGTVEPRYQTRLGFQIAGRMVARAVYVGDLVKKGERLAALDPSLERLALDRANAGIADAEAQLADAQGVASRQDTLVREGAAPQSIADTADAELATAKARVDQEKAALRIAEDQLGYTELHANFDGVVSAWSAEVGQYVQNGQAVVIVARPDVREAVVDIPDHLIANVVPGMLFTVRLQAAPNVEAQARVREIGPLADVSTRLHRVRMTLDDPPSAFRLGTTLSVLNRVAITPRVSIPSQAVLEVSGRPMVWIVSNGHVRRRFIETEPADGGMVTVRTGLAASDAVVVIGVHSLSEGQAVGAVLGPKSIADAVRL